MRFGSALAACSLVGGTVAQAAQNYIGFNSGATHVDYKAKTEDDFLEEFRAAKNFPGTQGKFTTFRLFSNVKTYTKKEPTPAFSAAVKANVSLVLGVWASGSDNIDNEIGALKEAIKTHGKKLTDLIVACSVGSEDVYRNSEVGKKNKSGPGKDVKDIVDFIKRWREAFKETALKDIPVGHVDTRDVWVDKDSKSLIDAVDFIGLDAYAYYENKFDNDIKKAVDLLDIALNTTTEVAAGKPIWLTEIGWPSSGPERDNAVPSIKNARYFWEQIGCNKLFNRFPTFWYILRDSNPENVYKFTITEKDNVQKPLFDLSCPAQSGSGFDSTTPASSGPPDVDSVRGAAIQQRAPLAMFAGIVLASAVLLV